MTTLVVARGEGELDRNALSIALRGRPLPVAAAPEPRAGPGNPEVIAVTRAGGMRR